MPPPQERGQINLTAIAVILGLIVTGVWVWKRLSPDTQTSIIDQAIPIAAGTVAVGLLLLFLIRTFRRRFAQRRERDRLITAFQQEPSQSKKLDLSFALIEKNAYRAKGLDAIASELKVLWESTLRQALGDKQHRIRGMAASHLGVLQDLSVVPLLINALEDDHPYVRACAALGLGRLRATDAKPQLEQMAKEDWDQSVRSRCREALDRMP
ncbi:MAG: HEAT repeat domain-containing protein [Nitrospira sp.]|nr:HEAT repeat domain-containing protein [Nitrospira sp.]